MKIFHENIINHDSIVVVKEETFKHNDFPFHSHPEYEIILILESAGKRIVGDSISEFHAIDLCMFGKNLPHTFYSEGLSEGGSIRQVVIQFHENFLGAGFFNRKPFKRIEELLQLSSQGIVFGDSTKNNLSQRIQALTAKGSTEMIIDLLSILNLLSLSKDFRLLSSPAFLQNSTPDESSRMSKVYEYILENFKRDISLEEAASIACLSPAAFCRYFKKFTRKTFSEFMNDLRIGFACKLLQGNNIGISQASMEAGFNSVSYFNRKFKILKGLTPMEYRKNFRDGKTG